MCAYLEWYANIGVDIAGSTTTSSTEQTSPATSPSTTEQTSPVTSPSTTATSTVEPPTTTTGAIEEFPKKKKKHFVIQNILVCFMIKFIRILYILNFILVIFFFFSVLFMRRILNIENFKEFNSSFIHGKMVYKYLMSVSFEQLMQAFQNDKLRHNNGVLP